ncbi:MAG: Maf family nucleotide pyrophosphatase [Bacteroidales bacterium]|jgi:septum formation protein|nr:Maf family nucleotide pyrophosphatase [Bacteroidales bacterium]
MEYFSGYRLILASRSPRRQMLLKELGLVFDTIEKDFDESFPSNLKGKDIALYLSEKKAESLASDIRNNKILITADTIVWCDGELLGKPAGREEAVMMIGKLSSNTHQVITGVTLLSEKQRISFAETTSVTFDAMSEGEIEYYVDNFSPYDKAGAYGIQEWIGLASCSRIEGSYFNVVGLPVQRLYRELIEFIRTEKRII